MKYAIMVLALVGVLARPTAAIAEKGGISGNVMLETCQNIRDLCSIYSMGWRNSQKATIVRAAELKGISIVDGADASADAIRAEFKLYWVCIPQKVTNGQMGDVLIKYLQDHPEKRHNDVGVLAWRAFRKAFPC